MHTNFVSRFALTALLSLPACLGLSARADVAGPSTITFSVPGIIALDDQNSVTIHKSDGYAPITMNVGDPAGMRNASFSGGYASASGYFPAGTQSATMRLYFFASYFPTGDYPFKGTVINTNGVQTTRTLMVHLVP